MARRREPGSTLSFSGIGLKPAEDKILIAILKREDISVKKVIRVLIRKWIEENK